MSAPNERPNTSISVSKRGLLKGVLAAAGGSVVASSRAIAAAASRPDYDVIVVGGGTAGIPTALFAAERGARVLIVEKSPVLGGTLDRSTASTAAAGTVFQKEAGIVDSTEDHFADIMRSTRGTADPTLIRLWTGNALDTINWLLSLGVKFNFGGSGGVVVNPKGGMSAMDAGDLAARGKPGKNAPVTVSPAHVPGAEMPLTVRAQFVVGAGRRLIEVLEPLVKKAETAGKVAVKYNSRVVDLLQDDNGAVMGAVIEDEKGGLADVTAKNVVLTAGGCTANQRMYEELHKVPLYYEIGYPFNQGDGLLLGQAAGGYLRGGEGYIPIFGVVMSDDLIPSTPTGGTYQETVIASNVAKREPWEIWVNSSGERFVQEDTMVSQERERALGKQPGHRMWIIHDQNAFEKAPSPMGGWNRDRYIKEFGSNPWFFKAPTLRQLALKAGVDPRAVAMNVADYNRALKNNAPDRFGRTHRPAPIEKPPFYAVRFQGFNQKTFAGLAVDYQLRVVRRDGTPVPNLYASGEILGSTALGNSAHAVGSLVTPALTFGRLLGQKFLQI